MTVVSACSNPSCSCDPCSCTSCTCNIARLGHLERRVMDILWATGGSDTSVRQVADELPEYAYTTVATVLDRLTHKGVLKRRMDGRAIRFAPSGSKGAHTAVLMRHALSSDSDPAAALARFAENLSEAEVKVLRRALDKEYNCEVRSEESLDRPD
jgi:predicted transcriptional regulator